MIPPVLVLVRQQACVGSYYVVHLQSENTLQGYRFWTLCRTSEILTWEQKTFNTTLGAWLPQAELTTCKHCKLSPFFFTKKFILIVLRVSSTWKLVLIHWILMSGSNRFTPVSEFTPLRNKRSFLVSDGSLYESMYDTQTTPLNHSDAAADLRVSSRLDSGHRVTRAAFERMTRIVIELGNFLQDSGFTT